MVNPDLAQNEGKRLEPMLECPMCSGTDIRREISVVYKESEISGDRETCRACHYTMFTADKGVK